MKPRRTPWPVYAGAFALIALCAHAAATHTPDLGADETKRLLSHGPWPAPAPRDRDNPLSGDRRAIAFGQRLFFDSMLSSNGYVACASCHQPDRAWTDLRARAQAIGPSRRNTPTLANLGLRSRFGWSGATDSLWRAARRPLLEPDEMNSSPRLVARRIGLNQDIACRYESQFGAIEDPDDPAILVNIARAIAAFVETLATGPTPFDRFRDAVARADHPAASEYPPDALRGLRLFIGDAGCAGCHAGPNFSDGMFHATGTALGIPGSPPDPGAGAGRFRTPSLRNVAVTPPYLHDGSLDTLEQVVRRYLQVAHALRAAGAPAPRRALTEDEVADLAAFLRTLTDARGAARTPPPHGVPCVPRARG